MNVSGFRQVLAGHGLTLCQKTDSPWPPRQLARQILCLIVEISC